ncbi:MAG: phenylalanine--tRNA ligase subunit alpha [Candidatus Micrarchaeia archaeon]
MHPHERLVLAALSDGRRLELAALADMTSLPPDAVRRACHLLAEKKLVNLAERRMEKPEVSEEGHRFLQSGFPEQRVAKKATAGTAVEALSDEEKRVGIPWAVKNGWIVFKDVGGKKIIEATGEGERAAENFQSYELYRALEAVSRGEAPIPALLKRGLVVLRSVSVLSAEATEEGRKVAKQLEEAAEVGVLTRELITSGRWQGVRLQAYDVSAPARRVFPGKPHPLVLFMDKIRRVFLELGFTEMTGPCVESAFWNFDALFQPQDHPARELHDTFYLKQPARLALPERSLVERVRRAHERGWRYRWDKGVAARAVLRTHTTAVSARYLADIGAGRRPAGKYFAIGRVFRNEATDFKHLAEFHQVEGIVVWERATFRHLLGLLKEFYARLGFAKVRFRPHYFPYTEPSLEIEAFFEEKNAWVELGGAGIFRPEVCLPLWGKYPVLAWGLSLERPVMLLAGLQDIRTFYRNDLGWLRSYREVGYGSDKIQHQ